MEALKKKFSRYGVNILGIDEENHMVYSDNCMVHIEPDGSLAISFQLGTIPEDVAVTVLILKEVKSKGAKNNVRVTDSHMIKDKTGGIIFGKEAEDYYATHLKENVMRAFKHDMMLADDNKCFQA
jgi:hypothetical protein